MRHICSLGMGYQISEEYTISTSRVKVLFRSVATNLQEWNVNKNNVKTRQYILLLLCTVPELSLPVK
jgi:hypothetical protein